MHAVCGLAGTFDAFVAIFSWCELTNCLYITFTEFAWTFWPYTTVLYRSLGPPSVAVNVTISAARADGRLTHFSVAALGHLTYLSQLFVMRIKKLLTNSTGIHETWLFLNIETHTAVQAASDDRRCQLNYDSAGRAGTFDVFARPVRDVIK